MGKKSAALCVLIAIVGVAAIYLSNSGEASRLANKELASERSLDVISVQALGRETVHQSIARAMESEDLESLDPALREPLVQSVSELLATWVCGTQQDYDALMQSWGGVYRFQNYEGVPGARWREAGEALAIRELRLKDCRLRVLPDEEVNHGFRLPPMTEAGRPAHMTVSMYDFGQQPFSMIRPGCSAVEAFVPVKTNDGTSIDMRVWMVWNDRTNRWTPCFCDMRGEQGKPLPLIIF